MYNHDILDFAVSEATGLVVDIRDVVRGLSCRCVCPKCGRPLAARKGPRRRHHFSHLPTDLQAHDCQGGPETGLHMAAKQIVAGWESVLLPALLYTANQRNHFGQECEVSLSLPGDYFPVDFSVLPDDGDWRGDWRPDVVLRGPKGELRVEIKVSHGVGERKQQKVERDGIATIEYDLSDLRAADSWNMTTLEHALRADISLVRWVYHPGAIALREKVHAQLALQVAQSANGLITESPVFGEGPLVYHPWLGLVPKDLELRMDFIAQTFSDPENIEVRGAIMRIRKHALLNDSWLVVFIDLPDKTPRAGYYDALLSAFLAERKLRSIYIGKTCTRIVRGVSTPEVLQSFAVTQDRMFRSGHIYQYGCRI